ncbi:MAG: hypothetical protein U0R78_09765 [Nocardioidaceae bacterium]
MGGRLVCHGLHPRRGRAARRDATWCAKFHVASAAVHAGVTTGREVRHSRAAPAASSALPRSGADDDLPRRQILNTGAPAARQPPAPPLASPARPRALGSPAATARPRARDLFGPLSAADGDLLALPAGFSYQLVAVSGETELETVAARRHRHDALPP